MTTEELNELERLLAEATPGPWSDADNEDCTHPLVWVDETIGGARCIDSNDYRLCFTAHETLPRLIAAARRLATLEADAGADWAIVEAFRLTSKEVYVGACVGLTLRYESHVATLTQERDATREVLNMIGETLRSCGIDVDKIPPMNWSDAIRRRVAELEADIKRRQDEDDSEGWSDLKRRIAELESELLLWRPLTPEEAQKAYDDAEARELQERRRDEVRQLLGVSVMTLPSHFGDVLAGLGEFGRFGQDYSFETAKRNEAEAALAQARKEAESAKGLAEMLDVAIHGCTWRHGMDLVGAETALKAYRSTLAQPKETP